MSLLHRLPAPSILLCCSVPILLSCAVPTVAQEQGDDSNDIFMGELFFAPEEEAEYRRRYDVSISRSRAQNLYEPLEAITGTRYWAALPAATPEERTISDQVLDEAADYAERNNSSALIVWRNGRIEIESYFDGQSRVSLLNSFSLAKPITALAVGRAMMLGKIRSLDQPVADFVEEWQDDPLRAGILVRHLLDMRTGFLRQASSAESGEIMARSFLHPRSEEILIKEYPVVDAPGTRYEYNNAASSMVAILIERATGRRYAEFIGTEILQKIGAMGGGAWVNRKGGLVHSGCCTLLPADTFLRLGILTLRDGVWDGQRLLPESYVDEMTRATVENPYYGLAVYVTGRYTERRGAANPDLPLRKTLHSEPYLASDLFLFDGNMNQVVYIVPSQDLVILRTGRAPPQTDDMEWDNAYLPNLIMRGIVREKRPSLKQQR